MEDMTPRQVAELDQTTALVRDVIRELGDPLADSYTQLLALRRESPEWLALSETIGVETVRRVREFLSTSPETLRVAVVCDLVRMAIEAEVLQMTIEGDLP